jgi:hypothetical protein
MNIPQEQKLLVLVPSINPRVQYAFQLLLHDTAGFEFQLTTDVQQFLNHPGPRFSYTDQVLPAALHFTPHRLLFEKGIHEQHLNVFEWEGTFALFGTHHHSAWPFDPFAASFYLASRYEEYMPHLRDAHDRYEAESSLAFQKNFLTKPLINIWAVKLRLLLKKHFPQLGFNERKYRFISTLDIDNAWAFRQKGIMRTAGAYARALTQLDLAEVVWRTQTLAGIIKDPFDTYDFQIELQRRYGFRSIYFILLGEYGENDKNVSPSNRKFRSLIKLLADYAEVGIHPSYASNREPSRLKTEIATLSKILKREVTRSRQHFLILKLPGTYRNLIARDITDDYTMGYAHHVGFRASICTPYFFYDLDQEQMTPLRIHPFAVMDATLKYYMKIEPQQAMDYIKPLIQEVKNVNGDFVSLWHNESLSDYKMWEGWKQVYVQMIEEAVK